MMTTILLPVICVLLMVIYVLIIELKRAERHHACAINELGRQKPFDSEQEQLERQHSRLKRLLSQRHTGLEHQLFVVSILAERCSQREEPDLLCLQCFLLDVLEFTSTRINRRDTYRIQQQVRDKLTLRSSSSWHEREHEVEQ